MNIIFQDVIFTDESRIEVCNMSNRSYRKKGEPLRGVPKAKHPYSALLWAGISREGPTDIVIFNGIMKSPFYQEEILQKPLKEFIDEHYPQHHRFMQDNDPKHTSNSTKQFMEDNSIFWWRTPASSPDLNPIENLWHELKAHNSRHVKPKTKDELVDAILEFWGNLDKDRCNRYINHLEVVIPKVIEVEGGPSGY